MSQIIDAVIPDNTYQVTYGNAQLMVHYAACSLEEKALLINIIKNPTLLKILEARRKAVASEMFDLDTTNKSFKMSYNIHRVEVLLIQDLVTFFKQVEDDLVSQFPGLREKEEENVAA